MGLKYNDNYIFDTAAEAQERADELAKLCNKTIGGTCKTRVWPTSTQWGYTIWCDGIQVLDCSSHGKPAKYMAYYRDEEQAYRYRSEIFESLKELTGKKNPTFKTPLEAVTNLLERSKTQLDTLNTLYSDQKNQLGKKIARDMLLKKVT